MLTDTVTDNLDGTAPARVTTTDYDPLGRVWKVTEPEGGVTVTDYDTYGNLIRQTDQDGVVTEYTYYDKELKTQTVKNWTGDPNNPGPAADLPLVSRSFTAGHPTSEVDATGYTTTFTWTQHGQLATKARVNGATTYVLESDTYDKAGNLTQQVANDSTPRRRSPMTPPAAGSARPSTRPGWPGGDLRLQRRRQRRRHHRLRHQRQAQLLRADLRPGRPAAQ